MDEALKRRAESQRPSRVLYCCNDELAFLGLGLGRYSTPLCTRVG
jgi:hypothetical protein